VAQIGNPTTTTLKPEDRTDTNFMVLLNAINHSLWVASNYTPYGALGQLAPIAPKSSLGGSTPDMCGEELLDVTMLLSSEESLEWDATKLKNVIEVGKGFRETRGLGGLAAKMAEQEEIAKPFWEGTKVTPVTDRSELKGG
jgi:hypothetical protein